MSLESDIKKTLEYERQYDCTPQGNELLLRLIGSKPYQAVIKRGGNAEFERKSRLVKKLINKYFLGIKEIVFVGITGSVASGYPKSDDDIDLIIVTKPNRLWLTRLKTGLILMLNRVSFRFGQSDRKIKDKLCMNMWLETGSLKILENKQILKNAMDMILMVPILDRGGVHKTMLEENSWVKKFQATGYFAWKKFNSNTVVKKYGDDNNIWNDVAFGFQMVWMKHKIKLEEVNKHYAYFHPNG